MQMEVQRLSPPGVVAFVFAKREMYFAALVGVEPDALQDPGHRTIRSTAAELRDVALRRSGAARHQIDRSNPITAVGV
jgi:hypothetical protein